LFVSINLSNELLFESFFVLDDALLNVLVDSLLILRLLARNLVHGDLEIVESLHELNLEDVVECQGSKETPDKWRSVKDPPAPNPNTGCQAANSIDNHGAEGPSGVDAATSEWDQNEMSDEDGPADGNGSCIPRGALGVNGRQEDGKYEQIRAHTLNKESATKRYFRSDCINSEAERGAVRAVGFLAGAAHH